MSSAAFSQWECEVIIYRADDNGAATDVVEWLGGCENKMEISQGFEEERADRSGDPYARFQHLEEAHTVNMENLWLSRFEAGELTNPRLRRNQRFVAVLLWTDESTGIWHKRTYYGAQINPLTFSSDNEYFTQRVPMRASYFLPTNGRLPQQPTLTPTVGGIIRYVTDSGQQELLQYDFEAHTYTALATPTGKIEMPGAGGGYQFRMLIGGVLALAVDMSGKVLIKTLVATGGSFASGTPRAEFYNGLARIATLTADGTLAVANFTESADNPLIGEDFQFRAGGNWLVSLAAYGAYAPAIADTLP